eukprot:928201-Prymnesium_polylepis.1
MVEGRSRGNARRWPSRPNLSPRRSGGLRHWHAEARSGSRSDGGSPLPLSCLSLLRTPWTTANARVRQHEGSSQGAFARPWPISLSRDRACAARAHARGLLGH